MNVHSKYRGPRQFLFALHVHVPYYYVRHIVHAQLFDPVPPIANDIKLTTDERIYNCQEKLERLDLIQVSPQGGYISHEERRGVSRPPGRRNLSVSAAACVRRMRALSRANLGMAG